MKAVICRTFNKTVIVLRINGHRTSRKTLGGCIVVAGPLQDQNSNYDQSLDMFVIASVPCELMNPVVRPVCAKKFLPIRLHEA